MKHLILLLSLISLLSASCGRQTMPVEMSPTDNPKSRVQEKIAKLKATMADLELQLAKLTSEYKILKARHNMMKEKGLKLDSSAFEREVELKQKIDRLERRIKSDAKYLNQISDKLQFDGTAQSIVTPADVSTEYDESTLQTDPSFQSTPQIPTNQF